ncbi:MAG: DUF4349 domain-containing protein, partial [Acidobacteriota bacterium]
MILRGLFSRLPGLMAIIVLAMLVGGCDRARTVNSEAEAPNAIAPARPAAPESAADQAVSGSAAKTLIQASDGQNSAPPANLPRKIIKNGELGIVVKTYEPFFADLQQQISASGGYISQTQVNRGTDIIYSATVTLRVPPDKLDTFISWLRQQGTITSEKITADDISEHYYDLQARLANARRFEARLLEMLKTQTGKLEDLVLVEEKLNQVREQIEQFEGKLRYYDSLTAMATLTLSISVKQNYIATAPTFGSRAKEAWNDSLEALGEFCQIAILFAIAVFPWLIPLAIFALICRYGYKFVMRVYKQRKA